jgi:pimeloyl-ACP methyl ester carboxylesterase
VVLVHGAWHGAWCWDAVVRELGDAGIASVTVDNPSVARVPSSLDDDAAHLRAVLDAVRGPVLLVGHSYGGAVITAAGDHPDVAHLVYVTAFALDEGESVVANDLIGGEAVQLGDALQVDTETVSFQQSRAIEFFFHDCDREVGAAAAARLRPMSMAAMTGTTSVAPWRTKPSTFVLCTDDRAVPPALQRSIAKRLGTTVEIASSHSPFLSRPAELAALLHELAQDSTAP